MTDSAENLTFGASRAGLQATFQVTLEKKMIDDFISLSGDNNPLHADPEWARHAGMPDRVAHGMLVASFFSTLVGVHLVGKNCLLHGMDVDFHRPVFGGQQLTVKGEVVDKSESVRQLSIIARITNDQGLLVAKARIRVGFVEKK